MGGCVFIINLVLGNGVDWFLDVNDSTGNLRAGNIGEGGADVFDATGVPLSAGDLVYLIIDQRGDFATDTTKIEFIINLDTEPLPGDGNGDGWVDGLDYLLWASNFGTHPGPNGDPSDGDYNDDGWVTGLDYLLWAGNFGTHNGVAVPEPTTLMLAVMGTMTLLSRRRRRA